MVLLGTANNGELVEPPRTFQANGGQWAGDAPIVPGAPKRNDPSQRRGSQGPYGRSAVIPGSRRIEDPIYILKKDWLLLNSWSWSKGCRRAGVFRPLGIGPRSDLL